MSLPIPTEAIPDNTCYCQYLYEYSRPCPYCVRAESTKKAWLAMSTDEKSKVMAYRRILRTGKEPSNLMIQFINLLYDKYEGFDVGVMP